MDIKNRGYHCLIISIFILGSFSFWGCVLNKAEFTITNNSEVDRENEPIVLTRDQITDKSGEIPMVEEQLPVPYVGDTPIPAQIDDLDKDGEWDEVAFTLNIEAGETKTISIHFVDENEYPEFPIRTNVRFGVKDEDGIQNLEQLALPADELPAPLFSRFQMDGPAWENDKIGFRQYIDGRNGRDLYGKTSSEMALDTVGISDEGDLEDNYHVMLPWGRDILAVGNSLGLGGLAILRNNEPVRLGVRMDAERNNVDTTFYELLYEGPVRSSFRLTYKGWDTGTEKINLINDVTIWAGKYSHTNKVKIAQTSSSDTLIVGLVNIHNDNEPTILEEENYSAFYTHDRQSYDKEWFLGMGLIFPNHSYINFRKAPDSGPGITNSFLTLFELQENQPLKYEVVAGWELSNKDFTDADFFHDFVRTELRKIANPVHVE